MKLGVMGALALGVLLSGCGTTPFFFPITEQERQQVATLRAFRAAISPQANRAIGVFQRDLSTMLSLKLPSEYGVDLSPYFVPLPKLTIPEPPAGYHLNRDSGNKLLGYLVANQIFVTAVAQRLEQVGSESWQYDLVLQPTPMGQAGFLKVRTSGVSWQSSISAGSSTKPYIFGERYTRFPDSVQASGELILQQGAGKANFDASFSSFQPDVTTDLMLPQSLSFNGSIPGLSWSLNGMMSTPTAIKLQGMITAQGSQGGVSYMLEGTSSNGDVNVRLLNEEKAIDLSLSLQAGKLKGIAKSRVDRRFQLAEILTLKDGRVVIKYGDGSQEGLF